MTVPANTVPEVLDKMRERRDTSVQIALMDFQEMEPRAREEFLLRSIFENYAQIAHLESLIKQLLSGR